MFGAFFKLKHFKHHFCPNFPKLARKELTKNMTSKQNVCAFIWSAIFVKSKHIQRFCEGNHTFFPNIPTDFARIFTKSKFWGWACPPTSYTSVEKYSMVLTEIQLKICTLHGSLGQKGSGPLVHFILQPKQTKAGPDMGDFSGFKRESRDKDSTYFGGAVMLMQQVSINSPHWSVAAARRYLWLCDRQ